jgi:putative flippase GtrA
VKLQLFAERTARYTIIGAICAVLNNILVIGGSFLGVGYVAMSVAAFSVVTPLGYLMHTSFTFRERPSVGGLLRFSSAVATGVPIFILLMAIFCSGLGMPIAIAAPICTLICYVWNYALAHWTILHRGRLP